MLCGHFISLKERIKVRVNSLFRQVGPRPTLSHGERDSASHWHKCKIVQTRVVVTRTDCFLTDNSFLNEDHRAADAFEYFHEPRLVCHLKFRNSALFVAILASWGTLIVFPGVAFVLFRSPISLQLLRLLRGYHRRGLLRL